MHRPLAVHPGNWLKTEIVEAKGLSVTGAALLLGVGRETLRRLLDGQARLSLDMAVRFEKVFGVSAAAIVAMQAA